jgi:teichuronic acid biosynthesis glycosyltransferase TuaG
MLNSVNPRISIIVPSFNYQKLTECLILSVLHQSYDNWQLIIIDDYSTDDTIDILKKYLNYDTRIDIQFNNKNRGMVKCLNQGFQKANGEFIISLNADDNLADKKTLEIMVDFFLQNKPIGLVYTDVWVNDENCQKIEIIRKPSYKQNNLINGNFIATWCCMWRDSIFTKVNRNVRFDMCCDWDLWLRLEEQTNIAHIPEPLFGWYRHNTSLYHRKRDEGRIQEIKCKLDAMNRRGYFYLSRQNIPLVYQYFRAIFNLYKNKSKSLIKKTLT